MDKIDELLKNIEVLPASPAVLPKLARALANIKNSNVDEMVDIITYDSALTAKLLQIANSPYFGSATPITNVGEAVSHVGYDTIYLLASSISGENCLQTAPGTGLDSVLLWKHSVTSAFGAQHVAQAAGLDDNIIFTAGLLHDLGKVVFAGAYRRNYTQMFDPVIRGAVPLVEWEKSHYGCDHAEVGAALLERWKLPPPLVAGVRFHHRLSAASEHAPIAACVCLGNALSRTLEQPAFVMDPANPEIPPALQLLSLTPADLAGQWARVHQNWEFVQRLCDLRK
jgi:putative nucleotidyltransferase with HDIG domain